MADVKTLKAQYELTKLLRAERPDPGKFSPSRYPHTYAYDHVRSRQGFGSRAVAAEYVRELAERADLDREYVKVLLAEAYCNERGIMLPEPYSE